MFIREVKAIIRFFLLTIVIVFSPRTLAWLPCVLTCDAGCGGAAIAMIGANSVISTTKVNMQHININKANAELQAAVVSFSTNHPLDEVLQAASILNRMNRLVADLQVEDELRNDLMMTISDDWLKTIHASFGAASVVRATHNIAGNTSSRAYSLNVAYMTENVEESMVAYGKSVDLLKGYVNSFKEYSGSIEELDQRDNIIANSKLISEIKTTPLLFTKLALNDDELNDMQALISLIVNATPLSNNETDSDSKELGRKVFNAKLDMVHGAMASVLSSRAEFSSTRFADTSFVLRESLDDKMSSHENISSLINGRITSPEWYMSISATGREGLDREIAYLGMEEGFLLYRIMQRQELRNQMLALILNENLSKERNVITLSHL